MKCVLAILFFGSVLFGSEFEILMGKEGPEWIYVSKQEDVTALQQFEALFEKNKDYQFVREGEFKIPRTIHFVWLGPEEPSKENMVTWVEAHPDWQFKLWTDRYIDLADLSIELKDVSKFPFLSNRKQFETAQSWEEKSDILSLEILYQEGGLMVDLRSRCLKTLDSFHRGFDFYCGLKAPHPPIGGRNISLAKEVMGARPFHPAIGALLRSSSPPFVDVLLSRLEEDGNVDIVFPSHYFSSEEGYATAGEVTMPRHVARSFGTKEEVPSWLGKGALSLNLVALTGAWLYFARRKKRRK